MAYADLEEARRHHAALKSLIERAGAECARALPEPRLQPRVDATRRRARRAGALRAHPETGVTADKSIKHQARSGRALT